MKKNFPPVFIDRDGVINENRSDYVKSLDEWVPIQGSIEAIAELSKAGFPIVVVTNQSAVARCFCTPDDVDEIHNRLNELVEGEGGSIAYITYCPHHPDDRCSCRKPKTGMVDMARADLHLPKGGYMIGDATSDMELGMNAGLKTLLVLTGRGAVQLKIMKEENSSSPWKIVPNLREAADVIIANETER